MELAAGQCWAYRAPAGHDDSRIIIGAIVSFDGREPVICCSVTGAPSERPDAVEAVTIPFLPITESAFRESVTGLDGTCELPETFTTELDGWRHDPRGLAFFTVPFEGSLDRMIALQMAAIIGRPAA